MTTWKWLPDGKSVELTTDAGEVCTFEAATVKEHEWKEYYEKLVDDGEVFKDLRQARQAFREGHATYRNARENLKDLIMEWNETAGVVLRTAKDVAAFFKPTGLEDKFRMDRMGLIEFSLQFIARAYVRTPGDGK